MSTSSKDALEELWNATGIAAEACYERNKPTGDLIGSAFVARDLLRVSEALGQKELNYWGMFTIMYMIYDILTSNK